MVHVRMRERLLAIPDVDVPVDPRVAAALDDSIAYLGSDAAHRSLDVDVYWPKWHSPWWHALTVFEIGEARRIPARAAHKIVEQLNAMRVQVFPIHPGDTPPDADPHRDSMCHCGLGSMWQVLAACGIDVPVAVPWFAPWLARYQMSDGGYTCDNAAYLVTGECPSSMVGTIAPIEAMLLAEATPTLHRAATFLVGRELRLGSSSVHNAEERDAAPRWLLPCFPRFYFYDVLRGIAALVRYARATGHRLSAGSIAAVVEHLAAAYPDGIVRVQRQGFAGVGTRRPGEDGVWIRTPEASTFGLLQVTSEVGAPSPWLTRQWRETRRGLVELIEAGQVA